MVRWKILIAEDDPVSFKLLKWLLQKLLSDDQYELRWAQNGAELIEQTVKTHPDVIITDIRMPEVDGLTALELIAEKLSPDCELPKIIITSAIDLPDLSSLAETFRDLEVIPKPVEVARLSAALRKLLAITE